MKRVLAAALIVILAALGLTAWLGLREDQGAPAAAAAHPGDQAARGKYLAQVGDCMACHTARGGAEYAGGRAIRTPFGTIYSPNITPDRETGIGDWSADDFWRAIHNGKSRDGTLLYPAFPYPNYTMITREDADAMYAYFKSLPPVRLQNRPPEMRFPYDQRILLAGWRALFFRPGEHAPEPGRGADWNRGAYLVQGLGHCNACHTARNMFGATRTEGELGGGLIPMLNWYAPALTSERETGLGKWEERDIVDLLKTGVSARGVASGPMAEVVQKSLQHLSDQDIHAMAVYLKSLPKTEERDEPDPQTAQRPENQARLTAGAKLYERYCVDCHKSSGAGEPPHIPSLVDNRSVLQSMAVNPIQMVLHGGYSPSTGGNPRPYGMPPFGATLNDEEVAALVSYLRNSWGNHGAMVTSAQVARYRSVPLD